MRTTSFARLALVPTVVLTLIVTAVSGQARAADDLSRYLDLPMVNRNAENGPGGVNPVLPDDRGALLTLLNQARDEHIAPPRYAALLFQYWLVDATDQAGIDLAGWNPRAGVFANYDNLIRSYTYYENFQLAHRELQWAGMGGEVGADFGGGLIDFQLAGDVFDFPGIAAAVHGIVTAASAAAGPQVIDSLPPGLLALDHAGRTITPDDVSFLIGLILVMQKNIFSDLMPMHDAYVTGGVPALEEFRAAGLFGDDIMNAWKDIASGDADRVADGNAALLHREQWTIVGSQWDELRAYKGDVGAAVGYLSTVAASPSVAGVEPPRDYHPVRYTYLDSAGAKQTLTVPLPDWNWADFDQRWSYINDQLLPKYKWQVDNDWPALAAVLRTPYSQQMLTHQPIADLGAYLQSIQQITRITPAAPDTPLGAG
ncbi:hypothetical protein JK358_36700 [Nocardia sp. 2]|uniref:Tat pathway signal protein n=1 Tax=Nocardia acididurans TaxID=2802282 RepID=A0ABS1MH01_9NOCA|nr:hypothetical protein [Nocardia acididurans]MBL1079951.1 hypothetical protein [Nocardia acididurans]